MRRFWFVAAVVLLGGCDGGVQSDSGHPGEQIYNRYCFSCHAAGIASAPRTGDAEAWQTRLAKGREALLQATIDGVPPGMPPMGLCSSCTEEELSAAIDYMLERSIVEDGS